MELPTNADVARFTSHWTMSAEYQDGTITATDYGEAIRGQHYEFTVAASDPRASGKLTVTTNIDIYDPASGSYSAVVMAGTQILQNEGGAWEGVFHSFDYPGTPDTQGHSVLQGTGGYEGLTLVTTYVDNVGEGLIFPGSMPEVQ